MADSSFWQGKKVLITGANGFIGGNLSKYLVEKKADIFGLLRNINRDSFLFFEGIDSQIKLIQGDITDKELLIRVIVEEQIEI